VHADPDRAGQGVIMASVSVMPTAQQPDPAQALAKRLAEPRTAAAVNTLLDHADLLDGLVSRGDTITDSLADSSTSSAAGDR